LFFRQGHVAATWRRRDGKTFGPYYRLSYRDGGRQCSVYLGRAGALVERVRQALGAIQQSLAQHRMFNRMRRQILASLRITKLRVRALLRPFGLRLKGFEVRGWRISPLRSFLPRRRRWVPRISLPRVPQMPRTPRPKPSRTSPQDRLLRFLTARDGYVAAEW